MYTKKVENESKIEKKHGIERLPSFLSSLIYSTHSSTFPSLYYQISGITIKYCIKYTAAYGNLLIYYM